MSLTFFYQLDSRTSLPVRCILFTVIVSALLSLISIRSTMAFNDIVALVISGYYSSYLIASGLLVYRWLTGAIAAPGGQDSPYEPVNNVGRRLVWGPWRIPGLLGILINAFSVIYLTVAVFWSFWPRITPSRLKTCTTISSLSELPCFYRSSITSFMHERNILGRLSRWCHLILRRGKSIFLLGNERS